MTMCIEEEHNMLLQSNSLEAEAYWLRWCEHLWEQAEERWIKRTGQDHFYRREVVLPALVPILASGKYNSLVDIGSGDGYFTEMLIDALEGASQQAKQVLLLDRSERQLREASRRRNLKNAQLHNVNITMPDSLDVVRTAMVPRMIVASFVLQEIPALKTLLRQLSLLMDADDICTAIWPAPSYACGLRAKGLLRLATTRQETQCDWEWAGEYPITVNSHSIYLPYFHRSIAQFRSCLASTSLKLTRCEYLAVPRSAEARMIFEKSVYGLDILGVPSSVLLEIEKRSEEISS